MMMSTAEPRGCDIDSVDCSRANISVEISEKLRLLAEMTKQDYCRNVDDEHDSTSINSDLKSKSQSTKKNLLDLFFSRKQSSKDILASDDEKSPVDFSDTLSDTNNNFSSSQSTTETEWNTFNFDDDIETGMISGEKREFMKRCQWLAKYASSENADPDSISSKFEIQDFCSATGANDQGWKTLPLNRPTTSKCNLPAFSQVGLAGGISSPCNSKELVDTRTMTRQVLNKPRINIFALFVTVAISLLFAKLCEIALCHPGVIGFFYVIGKIVEDLLGKI